jgi:hypothetical protein
MGKKRCTQCGGKLGLGIRFRNWWNGNWWEHLRFCSRFCEANYEVERSNVNRHNKWLAFLYPRPT